MSVVVPETFCVYGTRPLEDDPYRTVPGSGGDLSDGKEVRTEVRRVRTRPERRRGRRSGHEGKIEVTIPRVTGDVSGVVTLKIRLPLQGAVGGRDSRSETSDEQKVRRRRDRKTPR